MFAQTEAVVAPVAPAVRPSDALSDAQSLVRQQRWTDAATLLGTQPNLSLHGQMLRFLARNMAALQTHRPEVYQTLISAPDQGRYSVGPGAANQATIFLNRPHAGPLCLSANADPRATVSHIMAQLAEPYSRGTPIALLGSGDGYLLLNMALHPPALFLTQQHPVYVFEPDPQLLLTCMMLHDYSTPQGPIQQPRFQFYVGPDCTGRYCRDASADSMLPQPIIHISLGPDASAIARSLQEVTAQLAARDRQLARELEDHYAAVDAAELARLLVPNPPRRPRVLLLTTRFSTVLQYSTRDCAEAFDRLGWQTRVLIEPTDYHRMLGLAIRRALAEFKPDLLLQIDHLRHEHGDMFPPQLPFACWVQDHLPNLTNRAAGRETGPRDFVLTDAVASYVRAYDYPRRQCIDLGKLSRQPRLPAQWACDGDDLVYVSNNSATTEELLSQTLAQLPADDPWRPLVAQAAQHIIRTARAGTIVETRPELARLLQDICGDLGIAPPAGDALERLIVLLSHPLASTLFRQQALGWAAQAADQLGLRLSIYGRGWENHPDFARFARGVVAYGDDLEQLTRRSRINLQLEMYPCTGHQRLLDGLLAGGFVLIRHNCSNEQINQAAQLVAELGEPYIQSVPEMLARCATDAQRQQLAQRVQSWHYLCEGADPFDRVHAWRRAGLIDEHWQLLPDYAEVCFTDVDSLRRQVDRFLADEPLRRAIADRQRHSVADRLTYVAGMRRTTARIAELLNQERPSP